MRIIYVGKSYSRHNGNRSFFYTKRFYNGLIRNGHDVHFFADRDLAKQLDPLKGGLKKLGARLVNKKFLNVVKNIKPDAVIFSHIGLISPRTMQEIRARYPDTRMAYLNVDAAFSPKNLENIRLMKDYCRAVFMTTGGAFLKKEQTKKCPFYFIPNITDSSIDIWRAFENEKPNYDVASFMHGQHNLKQDQVKRLSLAEKVAQISGIRTCYHGFDKHPGLYGTHYFECLGRSAMTLCLNRHSCDGQASTPETRYMYSSDRTAHVMGNGSMAFISKDFNLNKLYNNDEVVFFDTDEDLIEKVKFYKNNPSARQKIAKKGWEKAHRDFNERIVMKYVIEKLFERPLSQDYLWTI